MNTQSFTESRETPRTPTPNTAKRCSSPSGAAPRDRRAEEPRNAQPTDPFAARYGRHLPLGLRTEAAHMSWSDFTDAYSPKTGPVCLKGWSERRVDAAHKTYSATLQVDGTTRTTRASGAGAISAMTAIVYEAGYPVEINSFHQQHAGKQTATFLECSRGYQRHWAMGIGADSSESIVNAFVAAANLLSN